MRDSLVVIGLLTALIGGFLYAYDPLRPISGGFWLLLIFLGVVVTIIGARLMDYTPYIPEENKAEPEPKEETNLEIEGSMEKQGRYCRYCGKLNKDDAIFCESCGKKIA
jgi:DNA-directed RNA polymerase subunit RPC12/RpoP